MEQVAEKRCSKCGEVKPLDVFYRRPRNKDGRTAACNSCCAARVAKWEAENPEKVKAYRAKWRAENPEKVKANRAKWRAENREREVTVGSAWRAENPEKVKAYRAKWRAENPEKVNANRAKWRKKDTDGYVAAMLRMRTADCPTDLIELKREQLMLRRMSKQFISTIKESQNAN